ncbi:MAG: ABC transporter permease [Acidobacteria bacterium]|nr:ABC transporter permease [Acidobacteriota bacterium]
MQTLLQDLRYGARMLMKKPGFTLIAVVTLALGIGANTAVFSTLNAILLKPLPFDDHGRIVAVWETALGAERIEAAFANYLDWREQQSSFEHFGIYAGWNVNLTGVELPEQLRGFRVSASLLDVVGVKPSLGRGFLPDEEQPGQDYVAILSHGLWQRRFAGDPQIIGKTITLNGFAHTVVGVMPESVNFPRGGEVMAPLAITPELASNRDNRRYLTMARLKPGATVEQARQDLAAIAKRLERLYPNHNTGRSVSVVPILTDTVRLYKAASLLSAGAVLLVLLIACANVANLLLARATERTREIAVRVAVGASRWRITRQLLTESVILALAGGALGLLVALWGVEALKASLPDDAAVVVPGYEQIGINPRVLAFTTVVSLLTGILFGLAPAWQASKPDLNRALKEGGSKATVGLGRQRLRGSLVITEIALSLMLLVCAGLVIKSFLMLLKTDPGFNPTGVLTMNLTLPAAKYGDETRRRIFYQELTRRVAALPWVESAALINYLPLGQRDSWNPLLVEGVPDPPPGQEFVGRYRVCTPDYFKAMGVGVIKGRGFSDADAPNSSRVIIVNETLAKKFWPDGDALGKRLRIAGPLGEYPWMEVVGIVADVKHDLDKAVTPDYYLPHAQDPWATMALVVRTRMEPLALASSVRGEVRAIDKDQPVSGITTMTEVRDRSITHYRINGGVLTVLAVIGLILTVTGIYGVMSVAASQRTHEIGIRLALGAQTGDVLKLVIGYGLRLTLIGIAIGLLAAFGLTRSIGSVFSGVLAPDWLTFSVISLLLAAAALVACWIPARRATKVDPMIALRCE